MPTQNSKFLAASNVPETDGLVVTSRSQSRTVGAEGECSDRSPMSTQDRESLAAAGVPEPDGLVVNARAPPAPPALRGG